MARMARHIWWFKFFIIKSPSEYFSMWFLIYTVPLFSAVLIYGALVHDYRLWLSDITLPRLTPSAHSC